MVPGTSEKTPSIFISIGSWSAAVAVIAGAFGAHALKGRIDAEMFLAFESAVRYQMYHALAIVAIALTCERWGEENKKRLRTAGALFVVGTLLFSGSLYAMALTETRWFGIVTPFGGVSFILGWMFFAWFGVIAAFEKRGREGK